MLYTIPSERTVLVTKNPCLYPGDIRKLEAVDVKLLRHCMRDCIVFPTTGSRPHSDQISGSDLDGDQYWVYWGKDLNIDKPIEPLTHSTATKLTVSKITNEMVIDYVLDTIERNCYSIIADVHTVVADRIEKGTTSKECVELATLFYRAIDSPKTGETIDMNRVYELKYQFCKSFPRFMMKFDQSYYESLSIIENLYLKAKSIALKKKDMYDRYQITSARQTKVPVLSGVISNSELSYIQYLLLIKSFLTSNLGTLFRLPTQHETC
ncbi:unnamed protein product [Adineta steineri]|uniref:RNA-dependent RNA polymerase n=2 Tax=Adineta steineri TaxID=433720 RepID=A0A819SJR7_9BILA|nr:unnamed protein product [Adineta steineri]